MKNNYIGWILLFMVFVAFCVWINRLETLITQLAEAKKDEDVILQPVNINIIVDKLVGDGNILGNHNTIKNTPQPCLA